jgi:PAS domain S-box-containing protein
MSTVSTPTLTANGSAPTPVAFSFRLPLRNTDFDAGLAGLLHSALNGAPRQEGLAGLCAHLARVLRLRLALLARRTESGTMAIEAASAENGLWLELQHIPERWDGGLSSQGPAAAALRAGGAVHMRTRDEGFALWQAAAEAERVREVLAIPVTAGDGAWILELYFDGDLAHGASTGTVTVERLARSVETFMADLHTIAEQCLVARALASAGNAAFITDLEGTIVWSNAAFSALSGYAAEEVRGRNPNLLRSGQQGLRYYRELWGTIRAGKVWSGETVDRSKDGREYSIHQTVSPVAQDQRVTHYVSIQQEIGRERRARAELELASHLSPDTGLLTRAAFESEVAKACVEAPDRPMVLAVVALRGVQRAAHSMGEEMEGLVRIALARRVRDTVTAPDIAGIAGLFEYALLLRGDVSEARVEARLQTLREKLAEPLPYLGPMPELDIHCGTAAFPEQAANFHELWLKADRQLADEPYKRARRNAPN